MATPNLSRLSAEGQFAPLRTRSKIDAAWQERETATEEVDGVRRVIVVKPAGWEDDDPMCPISLAPIIITGVRTKMYPFVHDPQNSNPDNMEEALANPSPEAWVATPCGHAILAYSFGEYVARKFGQARADLTSEHIRNNQLTSPVTRQRYIQCGGWGAVSEQVALDVAKQVALMCKNAVPPAVEIGPVMPALPTLQEQEGPVTTIEDLLRARSHIDFADFTAMNQVDQRKIERLMRSFEAATRLLRSQKDYLAGVRDAPGLRAEEYIKSANDAYLALKRGRATTELTFIRKVMTSIDDAVAKNNSKRIKLRKEKAALRAKFPQLQENLTSEQQKELKKLVRNASDFVTPTDGFEQVLDTLRTNIQGIIAKANEVQLKIEQFNRDLPALEEAETAKINAIVPPPEIGRLVAVGTRYSSFTDLTTDDYEQLEEQEKGPFLESVNAHVNTLRQYGTALNTQVFNKKLSQLIRWFETKNEYNIHYASGAVYKRGNKAYQNERVQAAFEQLTSATFHPVDYGSKIVDKAERAMNEAEKKLAMAERAAKMALREAVALGL